MPRCAEVQALSAAAAAAAAVAAAVFWRAAVASFVLAPWPRGAAAALVVLLCACAGIAAVAAPAARAAARVAAHALGWLAWQTAERDKRGAPPERGAVGLRNLGNSCFMNATLQALAGVPDLAA